MPKVKTATPKIKGARQDETTDAKTFEILKGASFGASDRSPVWKQEKTIITRLTKRYTVVEELVTPKDGGTPWTAHKAVYMVNGVELDIRYRSGVTPNPKKNLVIANWVALRNWPSDADQKIKKGSPKLFATNS
jgi:hypothetical protein